MSPAIAIEQKVNTRNPRSTVGTSTEIYDYLKLLFARIGKTYSPVSGKEVKRDTVTDVVDFINQLKPGTRVMISSPLKVQKGRKLEEELNLLLSKGFARVFIDNEVSLLEDLLKTPANLKKLKGTALEILIDRAAVNREDEDLTFRLSDSVQTAFFESHGFCTVHVEGQQPQVFSDLFELDGISFTEPSANLFGFNNSTAPARRARVSARSWVSTKSW